jgi:DNA-binding MarR family transcriptional regulator
VTRKFEETAGFLVADIARMMRVRFHDRARKLGLTRAQWTILNRVSHNQGINQTGLAELLEVDVVTVSRLIDALVAAGWLERRVDPLDRRMQRIHVASEAFPLLDQMDALGEATEREAFDGLDEAEMTRLRTALSLVRRNLSDAIGRRTRPGADSADAAPPRGRKRRAA